MTITEVQVLLTELKRFARQTRKKDSPWFIAAEGDGRLRRAEITDCLSLMDVMLEDAREKEATR